MLMSSEICADFVGNFMSSMFTVPGKKESQLLMNDAPPESLVVFLGNG